MRPSWWEHASDRAARSSVSCESYMPIAPPAPPVPDEELEVELEDDVLVEDALEVDDEVDDEVDVLELVPVPVDPVPVLLVVPPPGMHSGFWLVPVGQQMSALPPRSFDCLQMRPVLQSSLPFLWSQRSPSRWFPQPIDQSNGSEKSVRQLTSDRRTAPREEDVFMECRRRTQLPSGTKAARPRVEIVSSARSGSSDGLSCRWRRRRGSCSSRRS